MTFEQLHFAFGAFVPFVIFLFFYNRKYIFLAPLIMTITGTIAFLPYFFGWTGPWTNIFFLYNTIHHIFNKGQFYGYALIILMFTTILSLQALYLWRSKYA